jgi:Protein-L-isoaspartate(D-aspartate) O-methyltransferase (PCMT)
MSALTPRSRRPGGGSWDRARLGPIPHTALIGHPSPADAAMAAVPEEDYTLGGDGQRIPQTSHRPMITSILQRLGVEPGMRVLEIGPGSGYTGAGRSSPALRLAASPRDMGSCPGFEEEDTGSGRLTSCFR